MSSHHTTPTPSTPTIAYDTEIPPSSPLEPPNLELILKEKRKTGVLGWNVALGRGWQTCLTCFCIALSALQANGVYVWPTYGPVVAKVLDLDNAEAQTIVVGGILGVYLMAAPLGALSDRYGPRTASLLSAFLSLIGYMTFALILKTQPPGTPYVHLYLTASLALVGAATVGSYFACLTTASLSFPNYPTLSLSLPLSLIGLSSLILSSFSTLPVFSTPSTPSTPPELDAIKYITFLGLLSPAINLFSAAFMKILPLLPPSPSQVENAPIVTITGTGEDQGMEGSLVIPSSPIGQLLHLDEHTPLLIGGPEAAREEAEGKGAGEERGWDLTRLVKDKGFWCFGILLALCIGPAETIIASIGSILTFLLPPSTTLSSLSTIIHSHSLSPFITLTTLTTEVNPLILRNKHVFILSLCSTAARLVTGITADYLSPPLVPVSISTDSTTAYGSMEHQEGDEEAQPAHRFVRIRKVRLERSSFAAICSGVLGAVFGWCAWGLKGEGGLWVLSGGVGLMYGALFTLTPAIISSHFGPSNFGLAWGMISYFPALGSVIFSYIYALLSVSVSTESVSSDTLGGRLRMTKHDDRVDQCYGSHCFEETFWIAAGCCFVSAGGLWLMGRKWRV